MKRRNHIFYVIIMLVGFMHIYGIWWGIPGRERVELLFGKDTKTEEFIPAMHNSYDEIDEMLPYYGLEYCPEYNVHELIDIDMKDATVTVDKAIVNAMRSYLLRSYGSDEQRIFVALRRISPGRFEFNPYFYEYGGAYLYPIGLFFYGLSKLNLVTLRTDMTFYLLNPDEMGKMFFWGRIFGAVGAILSVIVFALLCKELFGDKRLIYLLVFLYGAAPGFVVWSHYLKPFTYGMFWLLLSLLSAVKFYNYQKDRWLYLAAVFAGVSFATLLSYGYIYWAVVVFILFAGRDYRWKLKNFLMTCSIFFAVFFAINPYILFSLREFSQELQYLREYWPMDISFNSLLFFTAQSLRYGLGTLLWALSFIGILGSLVYKSGKKDWLFFLILIPGLIYFAFTTARWVHYSIFLYPLIILPAGFFMSRLQFKKTFLLIMGGIALYTVLYSSAYVQILGQKNIRTIAGEWINSEIPAGQSIGMFEIPSPWRTPSFRFMDYELLMTWEKNLIEEKKPEYFIVSEYQWLRGMGLPAVREVLSGYEVFKIFQREPSIMGIRFRHPENIPFDWCHPNPVILIWKRTT